MDLVRAAVNVYHSVRAGGDTKTEKSRRRVGLPQIAVAALAAHKNRQEAAGLADDGTYVFCTATGARLSAEQVRDEFEKLVTRAGLDGTHPGGGNWVPPEAEAHLRQRAQRCRCGSPVDSRPRRPLQHEGDRNRLPAPAQAGAVEGRGDDGPGVPVRVMIGSAQGPGPPRWDRCFCLGASRTGHVTHSLTIGGLRFAPVRYGRWSPVCAGHGVAERTAAYRTGRHFLDLRSNPPGGAATPRGRSRSAVPISRPAQRAAAASSGPPSGTTAQLRPVTTGHALWPAAIRRGRTRPAGPLATS